MPDEGDPKKTKRLWVRSGTQIIDGIWGRLRTFIGKQKQAGSRALTHKIRSFQWCQWHRGCDLWSETGNMLQDAFSRDQCV